MCYIHGTTISSVSAASIDKLGVIFIEI